MTIYRYLCSLFGTTLSAWAFRNCECLERTIDFLLREDGHCARQWFDEDMRKRRRKS